MKPNAVLNLTEEEDMARPRVLIASEDAAELTLIGHLVRQMGLDPHYAWNGLIALEMIMEDHVDMLVTVPGLSFLDGCSLVRLLRRFGRQLPIVLLSSDLTIRQLPPDMMTAATRVIASPFAVGDLMRDLAQAWQQSGRDSLSSSFPPSGARTLWDLKDHRKPMAGHPAALSG